MPPKYKLNKDGYYRTSVTVSGEGGSRRIYLRAKSEDELDELVRRTNYQIERGEICFNANTPFEKYAAEWLEVHKKHSISKKNYDTYEANLRLHINPVIGKMPLKDIRSTQCKKVLNTHAGESKSHVGKLRMTMYQIFEQAIEDEYIHKNPARKLKLPEVSEGTHRPITEFERTHILKVAETHRAGLWVLIMLYCGLRPSEAIALNWNDIDFKNNFINVSHSIYNKRKAKTSAGKRKVPMPEELAEKLMAEKKISRTTFIFHQVQNELKPHTDTSMRCLWDNFIRELDISMGAKVYRNQIILSVVAEDLTAYCLRHTCATDYQAAGIPLNVAKVLLGHEDVSVTANIYTHYSSEDENNAVNNLSKFWHKQEQNSEKVSEI
jgi:integrase